MVFDFIKNSNFLFLFVIGIVFYHCSSFLIFDYNLVFGIFYFTFLCVFYFLLHPDVFFKNKKFLLLFQLPFFFSYFLIYIFDIELANAFKSFFSFLFFSFIIYVGYCVYLRFNFTNDKPLKYEILASLLLLSLFFEFLFPSIFVDSKNYNPFDTFRYSGIFIEPSHFGVCFSFLLAIICAYRKIFSFIIFSSIALLLSPSLSLFIFIIGFTVVELILFLKFRNKNIYFFIIPVLIIFLFLLSDFSYYIHRVNLSNVYSLSYSALVYFQSFYDSFYYLSNNLYLPHGFNSVSNDLIHIDSNYLNLLYTDEFFSVHYFLINDFVSLSHKIIYDFGFLSVIFLFAILYKFFKIYSNKFSANSYFTIYIITFLLILIIGRGISYFQLIPLAFLFNDDFK